MAAHWCLVSPLLPLRLEQFKGLRTQAVHTFRTTPGIPQMQWTGHPFVNASGSLGLMSCMLSSADSSVAPCLPTSSLISEGHMST